jgi:hypothetical protein
MKALSRRLQRIEVRVLPPPETKHSRYIRNWVERIRIRRGRLPPTPEEERDTQGMSIAEILRARRNRPTVMEPKCEDCGNPNGKGTLILPFGVWAPCSCASRDWAAQVRAFEAKRTSVRWC